MNHLTALLVEEAVLRVLTGLLAKQPAAVVGIEADEPIWLSDVTYWRQPCAFETEAGELGRDRRSDRVVLAVPLITLARDDGTLVFRPPAGPVRPDEVELVWAISLDLSDGLDVHRCVYRSTPDGLLFHEVQTYNGDVRIDPAAPGWQLLQSVIST